MSERTALVGDVHGNLDALKSLLERLERLERPVDRIVLVGDYVNRGPSSSGVLETLASWQKGPSLICLAGNHDRAMLAGLETNDLTELLHMGGVPTILSYIGRAGGDVAAAFRAAVPDHHREFLRSLPDEFELPGLFVSHCPAARPMVESQFHVYGHVVQRSLLPKIGSQSAAIDTGCGTLEHGRLTALLWPDLEFVQVGSGGDWITGSWSNSARQ